MKEMLGCKDGIAVSVCQMIDEAASEGEMLGVSPSDVDKLLSEGKGFTFEDPSGVPITFGALDVFHTCVELRSVITEKRHRRRGLATKMAKKLIFTSQEAYDLPIVALANERSSKLFRKLGLREVGKKDGFRELWCSCVGCDGACIWPKCHCKLMVLWGKLYQGKSVTFSVIDISKCSVNDLSATANLYCKIWSEPPWNETFWKIRPVMKDFRQAMSRKNGHLLSAVLDGKIVGFTSGWEIDSADLSERTGGKLTQELGKRVFYIAELATARWCRGQGIGKQLTLDLIQKAKEGGADRITLRTNVSATAARALYAKLGFSELPFSDVNHPDRTYWVL